MRSFREFMVLAEASYDAEFRSGAQIRQTGEGGRIRPERKKSTPEIRRVRAVGGGKTEPVQYKPRKDIGQQRSSETTTQQPTQERGSARETQLAAAKEERRKAAQARIAAKKAGQKAPQESKPTVKQAEKAGTKLLSTKKPIAKPAPGYTPPKASGKTRAERDRERNAGKKELYNQRKAKLFSDYKEVHGSNPTGKERTRLLGLAHKSMEN